MLYLPDANVLITAQRDYYARDQVPEFWEWLIYVASENKVKIPYEILKEILVTNNKSDPLLQWINDGDNKKIITLDEVVDQSLVRKVVKTGYDIEPQDDNIETLGRDPFIIAYAMAHPDRCVVTNEVSKPSKLKQNKKIPDVCRSMSVKCCNTFEFTRQLKFSTAWRK